MPEPSPSATPSPQPASTAPFAGTVDWGGPLLDEQEIHAQDLPSDPRVAESLLRVGRIDIGRGQNPVKPCTGFLLKDGRLATCNHCINTADECARTQVFFFGADGQVTHQVGCASIEVSDWEKDMTVIRLQEDVTKDLGHFEFQKTQPVFGNPAYLSGYPIRTGRHRTYSACTTLQPWVENAQDVYHNCQSGPASSGSPLINSDTGEVMAIHCGGEKDPPAGRFGYGFGLRSDLAAQIIAHPEGHRAEP